MKTLLGRNSALPSQIKRMDRAFGEACGRQPKSIQNKAITATILMKMKKHQSLCKHKFNKLFLTRLPNRLKNRSTKVKTPIQQA